MTDWGGQRNGSGRRPDPNSARQRKIASRSGILAQATAKPMSLDVIASVIEASKAHARQRNRAPEINPFRIAQHPPGAMPPKALQMAMDESLSWAETQWSGGYFSSSVAEGLLFLGYPYLAELAQRPEYRVFSETIATEMTRKWIKFNGTGDEDKTEKIKELTDFLDALQVRDHYKTLAIQDGFFGRSHLFHDFGTGIDGNIEELKTPIGNGRDALSKSKVPKGALKRLQTVEAVWTYPMTYNAINPLAAEWYNPQFWYVMGKEVHCSRFLTFIGHPVPDMLKPAYSFGGLSLSQMAKPYVDIWLKTRESVGELIHSFSVMVLMTDLQTILQPGNAQGLLARVALFNALRDNQGTFVLNNATEDFKNVSASLAGLHELQAQAQEHMMSVARIPAVKFTGISPMGLNASSEGEMRAFNDTIKSYQEAFFRPNLTRTIDFAQLSLWGEVDQEITYEFESLVELTDKEKAEMRKADAEAGKIHIDSGAISPEEERTRIINDPDTLYPGLDPEDVPDLEQEEMEGLVPGKGGKSPIEGGPTEGESGGEGGGQDAVLPFAEDAEWSEADHERAANGQFGSGGAAAATLKKAAPALAHFKHIDPKPERYKGGRTLPADPHYHIMASTEVGPAFGKNTPNPVTVPGHGTATGIALKVNAKTKHIHFSELNSHIKGAGKAMVEAIIKAYPDYKFSVTDWSSGGSNEQSFWSKIEGKYPDKFAHDQAADETDTHGHEHAPAGSSTGVQFVSQGGGGGGGGSEPEEAKKPEPEMNLSLKPYADLGIGKFKSKKEHAAHLLTEGVSTADMLKALGWPSISMPAMAKSLGMKLEKIKQGGVTKYKGTPMTEKEKHEASVAAIKAKYPEPSAEKPKEAKTPAAAPLEKPTEAELAVAKKSTSFPTGGYGSEAAAVVKAFNDKYGGKTLTDPDALAQKVADYKQLKADITVANAKQAEVDKKAQAELQAKQKAAEAKAAEKLKAAKEAAAAKNKEYMAALGISETEATGFDALVDMMGGSSKDLIEKFKAYEQTAKNHGYPITGFQYALIRNYINGGYTQINQALRQNQLTPAQHVYAKLVNNALEKLPKFAGVVKRGATLPASEIERYKPGYVTNERSFLSTGIDYSFGGNVRYTIKASGQRGADFSKGANTSEKEVLFKANTAFLVHKVETKGGVTHIEMEEVDHHG